jgi:hypothetical protein
MLFLRSFQLLFFVFVVGMACSCFANTGLARLGEPGKCGRDCIYYVCLRLGQQVSLDEIDQQLDGQTDISFADMRRVFEERGFYCKSLIFNVRNIGRLQAILNRYADSLVAIAALPTVSETEHHFVIITISAGSRLTIFDVSRNRSVTVDTADYRGKPIIIPVLLVSKEPIQYQTFSGLEILSGIAFLVIILFFGYCFVTKRWDESLYAGINTAIRYCFRRLTFRRLSVGCGIILVLVLLVFSYREYHYHRHPLELVNPMIDLGDIELFSNNVFYLEVRNRSFRNILIEEIKVSCSCLTVEEYPENIAPKSTQKIRLTMVPFLAGNLSYQTLIVPQSATPLVGIISYNGFQQVRILPRFVNVGLVEKGEQETFACVFTVEGLRENLLIVESIKMHGDEPIFEVIGDLPEILRDGDTFAITIRHLGNAPKGTVLQSFEIKGKGDTGNEIILLSNIIGLVVE